MPSPMPQRNGGRRIDATSSEASSSLAPAPASTHCRVGQSSPRPSQASRQSQQICYHTAAPDNPVGLAADARRIRREFPSAATRTKNSHPTGAGWTSTNLWPACATTYTNVAIRHGRSGAASTRGGPFPSQICASQALAAGCCPSTHLAPGRSTRDPFVNHICPRQCRRPLAAGACVLAGCRCVARR